jgi:hypothetical protein
MSQETTVAFMAMKLLHSQSQAIQQIPSAKNKKPSPPRQLSLGDESYIFVVPPQFVNMLPY